MFSYRTIPPVYQTTFDTLRSVEPMYNTTPKFHYLQAPPIRQLRNIAVLHTLITAALTENVLLYHNQPMNIKRNTDVSYILTQLFRDRCKIITEEDCPDFPRPFNYNNRYLFEYGLKAFIGIHFINVTGQIQYSFEQVIPQLTKEYNFTEQLNVSLYLKETPKHRVRVYSNAQHIVVFTNKPIFDPFESDYTSLVRKLYAAIPLIMQWDTETIGSELLKSLGAEDHTVYWETLCRFVEQNDFLKNLKYAPLYELFDNISRLRSAPLQQKLTSKENDIRSYESALESYYRERAQLLGELAQIENEKSSYDKDAVRLLVDKNIVHGLHTDQIVNGRGKLYFLCSAQLTAYDKRAAKSYINGSCFEAGSMLQKFYQHIFLDEELILQFSEEVVLDFANKTVAAGQNCANRLTDFNNTIPNPHHWYFNCWGNYKTQLMRMIADCNLEGAFYTIKNAIGSINFTDGAVLGRFKNIMNAVIEFSYTPKFILWRDENYSTLHTWEETYEHYKNYYTGEVEE